MIDESYWNRIYLILLQSILIYKVFKGNEMEQEKYLIGQELIVIFENVLKYEKIVIEQETECVLSMAEIHTVAAIGKDTMLRMGEIADALQITLGTLTVMINNLVRKGYVDRYKSEEDRRVVKIGLTKKGRRIFDAHASFHENLVNALVKGADSEQQKTIRMALNNLWDFIQQQE